MRGSITKYKALNSAATTKDHSGVFILGVSNGCNKS